VEWVVFFLSMAAVTGAGCYYLYKSQNERR